MSANSFGNLFKISSFGESHGPALGCLIEGCPAGLEFDSKLLTRNMLRRRPGQSAVVSGRQEADEIEILSGLFEGRTLGTPIAVLVRNHDVRSQDYAEIKGQPRRGHADETWQKKFGHSDPRGGGRASGRETVSRVIGGSFAQMLIHKLHPEAQVLSFVRQIGNLIAPEVSWSPELAAQIEKSPVRCPDPETSLKMVELLTQAKEQGHSYGGLAEIRVRHVPAGLGQPVFHKIKADLASAFMSVGATCGVEFGAGFAAVEQEGSEFHKGPEAVYGGLKGGISNGQDWLIRVAFKPTSSVLDVAKKGRHDPCIVPRAVVVLEAMTHLVIADHLLWQRMDRV